MKLIYAYIIKYRNIEKQSFSFDKQYSVNCQELKPDHYSVIVENGNHIINIMANDNIENITAIVGKNGAGKTSWLVAMCELLESYEESKFIYIYADGEDYYIECNKVYIMDFDKIYHNSEANVILPEASIYKVNYQNKTFVEIERNKERIEKIAYIMVENKKNSMSHSYCNIMYSNIPRNGVTYEEAGIYYKFTYLYYHKGRTEQFNNQHLKVHIDLDKGYLLRQKRITNLLPEYYPKKNCLFDLMPSGTELYKKAFLLRMIELILSNFRESGSKISQPFIDEINSMADKYEKDINLLYDKFDDLVSIICELHKAMLNNNHANKTDTQLCFNTFLHNMKTLIEKLPDHCFENSFKIDIGFSEIKLLELESAVGKVFKDYDLRDILLEYINVINFNIVGLSDGYEFISNLYAAIYSSFKLFQPVNNQKIILALDEPDCYMHPEWSRRFVDDLYKFLKEEFSIYKFEILLTTHSPYILTDIPNENIIFLENGKIKDIESETFGQNIHSLLRQAFFLDSTIGEYSLKMITLLYEELKSIKSGNKCVVSNYDKAVLEKKISIIGEPLVKWKIEKLYYECFPEEKENAIKIYQDEIKKLKLQLKKEREE